MRVWSQKSRSWEIGENFNKKFLFWNDVMTDRYQSDDKLSEISKIDKTDSNFIFTEHTKSMVA